MSINQYHPQAALPLPDENVPLLYEATLNEDGITSRGSYASGHKKGWIAIIQSRPLFVVAICTLSILFIDIGVFLQMAPLTRILESIICYSYYKEHPDDGSLNGTIPEHMCKITPIQSDLATLRGWSSLFDCLPTVLLAVPYGLLADKYGRKPVLVLSIIGAIMGNIWVSVVCFFPEIFAVKLIWLSSVFTLVGGGAGVASSIILAIVADTVSETERPTIFFRVTASVLLAQLLAIPLSSVLMDVDLWLPMFLGTGAMILGLLVIVPLPETLKERFNDVEPSITRSPNCGHVETNESMKQVSRRLTHYLKWMVEESKPILASPLVTVLVLTFLVKSLGRSSIELLLQYASKRYDWTIAQASFLAPLRAAVQLVLLLIVLPAVTSVLTVRIPVMAKLRDLYISRASVSLLLLGCIGIGLSQSPGSLIFFLVLFALGSGFETAVRSLVTSLVQPHQVGRLYAAIATMDMVGGMMAGPSLSGVYSLGLRLGGPWIGLPFLVSGVLFFLVAVPLFCVKLEAHDADAETIEEED